MPETAMRKRNPYTLYKKQTGIGLIWYARFWNNKARKYTVTRSTGVIVKGKKERKREAELKASKMVPEIHFKMDAQPAGCIDLNFILYLENFWKPESSYVKECISIKKKPLSAYYVRLNNDNIRLHIKPFLGLNKLTLRELTAGHIKDWMTWAVDKGMSGRYINNCLNTMRVAVRYAIDREDLNKDPFRNIKPAADFPKDRGVLTPAERMKILNTAAADPRSKLAVLLGLCCGMRRGEARGLKWGDIDNGLIHLTHNYVKYEGLKKPKCGKTRTVPYPAIVERSFEEVRKTILLPSPESFVLESLESPDKPMGETFFRNAVRRELDRIGISSTGIKTEDNTSAVQSEQKKRNLTFHSLRHSFITLGRLDGISDLEMQAIAGHSSIEMMNHYTHAEKVIDFRAMREKLDKAVGM